MQSPAGRNGRPALRAPANAALLYRLVQIQNECRIKPVSLGRSVFGTDGPTWAVLCLLSRFLTVHFVAIFSGSAQFERVDSFSASGI